MFDNYRYSFVSPGHSATTLPLVALTRGKRVRACSASSLARATSPICPCRISAARQT
jgi:hypothetical protein